MKIFALVLMASLAPAEEAPPWVRQASLPVGKYPPRVSTVVLLHQEQLTVAPDGRRTMRERGAIRIVARSRGRVVAFRAYNTKTGRIRDFRAWLLPPDGREQQFKPNEIPDVALSQQYTYDEARAKALECPTNAPLGSVFAYEIVEEERSVFTQADYSFQEREPVLASRFVLVLPPG